MTLTGKAKETFEEWYVNNPTHYYWNPPTRLEFEKLDVRCQWGVYQDWADSIEMLIEVTIVDDMNSWTYDVLCKDIMGGFVSFVKGIPEFNNRQEARNAAIEKLNYLINER